MAAKIYTPKRIVLIDANSLLYRAFHALPPLTTPSGELIGAVYGFSSMLIKVIDELQPSHMAVAWDTKAPTFRHKMFAEYKGTRDKTPDELLVQVDKAHQVIDGFGIPQFAIAGFEADDIIGTMSHQANQLEDSFEVVVVTGDMDMLQLVNEKTKVFGPRKSFSDTIMYGIEEVRNKFEGLGPNQVVDYKALRGDPSDNIPGVRGIGEKTAIKLLNEYKDLDSVYQHLEEIGGKQQKMLSECKEIAYMSRDLAQIAVEAPVQLDLQGMGIWHLKQDSLESIFIEFGFKSLVSKIPDVGSRSREMNESDLDTEIVISQDFEKVDPDIFDVQVAAHLLTGEHGEFLELSSLFYKYLGKSVAEDKLTKDERGFLVYQLKLELERALNVPENKLIRTLFYELEMPLKAVIKKMEADGVLVNRDLVTELSRDFEIRIKDLETQSYREIGHEVNLNSPKQLELVLFDELRLPVIKKTKTQRSTAEFVLQQLRELHPFVGLLLKYRELNKIKTTYLDPLPAYLDDVNRVHTTYNQTRVASGRLSSENPNLQNIPTDEETGLRRLFIAPVGSKLISADYSQFELRIMAHITGDINLLEAFRQGADIHRATASRLFDKSMDMVTSDERRIGKTINFALMYGMGPHGLSESLGIGLKQAKEYSDKFLGKFPRVAEWKEEHLKKVREQGCVETMYGRRRYLPEINSSNFHLRSGAERIAINHPLQGTQADLIKMAMLRVDGEIRHHHLGNDLKMIMQVHDELVFEVTDEKVNQAVEMIKSEMVGSIKLAIPIEVHIGVGENWQDTK